MNLKDKVALVTGGSRGIGEAIVLKLATLGATVIINYIGDPTEAEAVLKKVTDIGAKGCIYHADVTDYDAVSNMIKDMIKKHGRLDIIVNNSGITRDNLLMRMDEQSFDDVIAVNLKGTFNVCKHATRHLLKQRTGSVINISSVVGMNGNAGQVNYAASKAGIIGLTKSMARELASRGIRVNAIAPGFIQSAMTLALSDETKKEIVKQIPLQTLGEPEDVANMVAFLASEDSRYVTGQVLVVDGGMSI